MMKEATVREKGVHGITASEIILCRQEVGKKRDNQIKARRDERAWHIVLSFV